ncbi:MAG: hypothetical protein Tsb009_04190 [Planctomycetaceae bacterium]
MFSVTLAADKKVNRRIAYLTAKEAGVDFAIQGEYEGEIATEDGNQRIGVQVIALGDGKFRAVGFPGGLPGHGWTGDEKINGEGSLENGQVILKSDKGVGIIKDGALTINSKDGKKLGQLKKVIRKSPTLGQKPPQGAVVLFDGTTAKHFKNGRLTKDGLLREGTTSHRKFQSFKLHLEFQLSFMPYARGQGRSNSGVYMQGRYETQILDSFGLAGKHNECGGIYSIKDPDVNMCFPPLSWQTYDIDFTAAKYDKNGKKIADAKMTVLHNGVVVHKDVKLPKTTTAAPVKEGPEPGPIYIQNHGNPLRFRNIWLVEKK